MEVEELDGYIHENWDSIKEQIRQREYNPQPVRRAEKPKPNGSKQKLGIPTVMDRVIRQGITQVISPMCEPLFSDYSCVQDRETFIQSNGSSNRADSLQNYK